MSSSSNQRAHRDSGYSTNAAYSPETETGSVPLRSWQKKKKSRKLLNINNLWGSSLRIKKPVDEAIVSGAQNVEIQKVSGSTIETDSLRSAMSDRLGNPSALNSSARGLLEAIDLEIAAANTANRKGKTKAIVSDDSDEGAPDASVEVLRSSDASRTTSLKSARTAVTDQVSLGLEGGFWFDDPESFIARISYSDSEQSSKNIAAVQKGQAPWVHHKEKQLGQPDSGELKQYHKARMNQYINDSGSEKESDWETIYSDQPTRRPLISPVSWMPQSFFNGQSDTHEANLTPAPTVKDRNHSVADTLSTTDVLSTWLLHSEAYSLRSYQGSSDGGFDQEALTRPSANDSVIRGDLQDHQNSSSQWENENDLWTSDTYSRAPTRSHPHPVFGDFRFPPPVPRRPIVNPAFEMERLCPQEPEEDIDAITSEDEPRTPLRSPERSQKWTPMRRTPPPSGVDYIPIQVEPYSVQSLTVFPGNSMLDMCMEMNRVAESAAEAKKQAEHAIEANEASGPGATAMGHTQGGYMQLQSPTVSPRKREAQDENKSKGTATRIKEAARMTITKGIGKAIAKLFKKARGG